MKYYLKDSGPSIMTILLLVAGVFMFIIELITSSGWFFYFSILGLVFMVVVLFYYLKATFGNKIPMEIETNDTDLSIKSPDGLEKIVYSSIMKISNKPSPDGSEAWVIIYYGKNMAKTIKMERKQAESIVGDVNLRILKTQ